MDSKAVGSGVPDVEASEVWGCEMQATFVLVGVNAGVLAVLCYRVTVVSGA